MIDFQRRTNPEAYRLMSLGAGLTDVHVPPLAEWLVTGSARVPSRDAEPGLARIA